MIFKSSRYEPQEVARRALATAATTRVDGQWSMEIRKKDLQQLPGGNSWLAGYLNHQQEMIDSWKKSPKSPVNQLTFEVSWWWGSLTNETIISSVSLGKWWENPWDGDPFNNQHHIHIII